MQIRIENEKNNENLTAELMNNRNYIKDKENELAGIEEDNRVLNKQLEKVTKDFEKLQNYASVLSEQNFEVNYRQNYI